MATIITSECINCGACEPECPNNAIYQGGVEWELNGEKHPALQAERFFIVPEKCSECVGFHEQEACAAVCPVDCCIPDPDLPETEAQLIAKAQQLHPDKSFGADFPSRFRQGGVASTPAASAGNGDAGVATKGSPAAETGEKPPPAAKAVTEQEVPASAGAEVEATEGASAAAGHADAESLPGEQAAAVSAEDGGALVKLPDDAAWEVPLDCFRCGARFTVPFPHVRSGVVLRCPSCTGSYVVTTELYGRLHRALENFQSEWAQDLARFREKRTRDLEEFVQHQRGAIEAFGTTLGGVSRGVKPPGAPRRRAWIFG